MSDDIVILYHSGYGHTAKVAASVAEGVKNGGGYAELIGISAEGNLTEADWTKLDNAKAIIFGTPTYMGSASWQFKKFADASGGRWMKQAWKNKIAAGFTNSGSLSGDKLSTLHQLYVLAMQHSMIWVGMNEMPPQHTDGKSAQPDDINRIGSFSGLMTQSNNESPDVVPPKGDHETARRFGARIAEISKRFI